MSTAQQTPPTRPLRAGIVGGGRGAFIGAAHRVAAQLDGQAALVAGALSANPEVARASAADWFLQRSYDSYTELIAAEAQRGDGIDFVIIATPNDLHHPVARACFEAGLHVMCEKPLALDLGEGEALAALAQQRSLLCGLAYTYSGYPAVRQARELVQAGKLGDLRKVVVEYHQDWLMTPLENSGHRQASWRTDPARTGAGGSVGDIGTHAAHLLEFVSGRAILALSADLSSFVPGRRVDDDAGLLLRLEGGARGTLSISQVACGEENNLTLRIYGEHAGLEWRQQEPNTLIYKPAGQPWQLLRTGHGYLGGGAQAATRLPAGHPEGYFEALAVIYRDFIADVRRVQRGDAPLGNYPTARDGLRGLRFIASAVESSRRGAAWVTL
jgi:predicted dehydrogenase